MKIYVITSGDYSDYHIIGVTDKKEVAEQYKKLHNNAVSDYDCCEIEEYDTDDIFVLSQKESRTWEIEYDKINKVIKSVREVCPQKESLDMLWPHLITMNVHGKTKEIAIKRFYDLMAEEKYREAFEREDIYGYKV